MEDWNANVYLAYGFIDDVKVKAGNWSVKVVSYPQPDVYKDADQPYRYGGKLDPTEENKDGWGEWITLGEPPWVITMNHGISDLKGKFVEIRYRGMYPWYGQAFVVNQPDTEDPDVALAEERGIMRILSAIAPII